MEKLLKILENAVPGVDFENGNNLATEGMLNSISIVSIVVALQEEYDVEFDFEDITKSNFESADSIMKMLAKHIK